MTTNTRHITVEPTAAFVEAALDEARRLDDDAVDDQDVLGLPDEEAIERVLRATNLELVRTFATGEPESVR